MTSSSINILPSNFHFPSFPSHFLSIHFTSSYNISFIHLKIFNLVYHLSSTLLHHPQLFSLSLFLYLWYDNYSSFIVIVHKQVSSVNITFPYNTIHFLPTHVLHASSYNRPKQLPFFLHISISLLSCWIPLTFQLCFILNHFLFLLNSLTFTQHV